MFSFNYEPKTQTTNFHQKGPSRQKGSFFEEKKADDFCEPAKADHNKTGKELNLGWKQENDCSIPKKKNANQEFSEDDQKSDQGESTSLALNQLLQQKSKFGHQGSVCWKTYLFPRITQIESLSKKAFSYFGLDLVVEETERTVWTHKPGVWKDIVQSVFELAAIGAACQSISKIFQGLLACALRDIPKGPNEPKTYNSANGKTFQHWIMLVPMPADIDTSEYIPLFISEFTSLSKKAFIRSAYHYQVSNIFKHPGLLAQIDKNGSYWNILEKASHNDVMTKQCDCLSEVLLNSNIREVVSNGFGLSKDANTWSDSIQHYAFGV